MMHDQASKQPGTARHAGSDPAPGRPTAPTAGRIVIDVRDITKTYRLQVTPKDRLWAALGRQPPPVAEHQALRSVSFQIARGESVGLLGINGAGKSTLLQIIAGTLSPTSGTVSVDGRIAALLELGAGFNRDWSGRRNAEFHCIVAGMAPATVAQRLADIEAFADIGKFFDQPMRSYSSGMYMRVAFAAAIAADPDILIVDEALAVGDARFQNKCFARFRSLQDAGCTIVFVTHSTELVKQFCTRGILLDAGCVDFDGPAVDATERYLELLHGRYEDNAVSAKAPNVAETATGGPEPKPMVLGSMTDRPHYNSSAARRFGDGALEIADFEVLDSQGLTAPLSIASGSQLRVRIVARAKMDVPDPYIGWILKRVDDTVVCGTDTRSQNLRRPPLVEGELWCVELTFQASVGGGDYFFDLGTGRMVDNGYVAGDWRPSIGHFQVVQKREFFGIANLQARMTEPTAVAAAAQRPAGASPPSPAGAKRV